MNKRSNEVLNKLEHIFGISIPNTTTSDPRNISDFISQLLENEKTIDPETFYQFSKNNKMITAKYIKDCLEKNKKNVTINTILQGIDLFNKDIENEK